MKFHAGSVSFTGYPVKLDHWSATITITKRRWLPRLDSNQQPFD